MERLGYSFSLDELIAKVREIAAEHPSTRYQPPLDADEDVGNGCSYLRGTSTNDVEMPGCLFGQLLPEDWVEQDPRTSIRGALMGAEFELDIITNPGGLVDDPRILWLSEVQNLQDRGWSWADTVWKADQQWPL